MGYKRVRIAVGIAFALFFCLFVLFHEKEVFAKAQAGIESHALVIKDDMWNFNPEGAEEFMKLAAYRDRYESLVATHNNGEIFKYIKTGPKSGVEAILIRIHLIPRVNLFARVEHQGNVIGWVEAVWLPNTIYLYIYLLLALGLLFVIVQLYIQLLKGKAKLEERVTERTVELQSSNTSLKQEIEERKSVEKALRNSEEKHRFLAENIDDVIWTMDLGFNFTYVSPASIRMHGWSGDQLHSLTVEAFLPERSLEAVTEILSEYLEIGSRTGQYQKSVMVEVEQYRSDKSLFWTEVRASMILDEERKPIGIHGVTRDINQRKKAEKENLLLQAQLERSKKMEWLGVLAGGVAHDLNNVLSGIVGYPDLLLMDLPPDSPMIKAVETIKDSGQKATVIVQDLLTLARRGVITKEAIDLNLLVEDYLKSPEHRQIMAHHPSIDIECKMTSEPLALTGSPVHLKKTIMNLVSNAAEAQPGGGKIEISTDCLFLDKPLQGYEQVVQGEYVVLHVKDRGGGIKPDDLERIFEPFYTKKQMGRSGTGLGLAVVWGTVQDHKGYINVTSDSGSGTAFELYFPLSREAVSNRAVGDDFESLKGNRQTILVVDDVQSQREIISNMLDRIGYSAVAVESGEAAVDYFRQSEADVVILDMIMPPGMDGLTTYEQILKIRPGQKAIINSGYAETGRVREMQRLGASQYLKKPYTIDALAKALKLTIGT